MNIPLALLAEGTGAPQLCRGTILDADGSSLVVCLDGQEGEPLPCEMLTTDNRAPISLACGDPVLAWVAPGSSRAIILGRVGPARVPEPESPSVPDELVIEARTSLTLCVGDGSISIRGDGRILIKGKDLVSHAKGMNRIRGGSVSIN
jgi:hypothetical protein